MQSIKNRLKAIEEALRPDKGERFEINLIVMDMDKDPDPDEPRKSLEELQAMGWRCTSTQETERSCIRIWSHPGNE